MTKLEIERRFLLKGLPLVPGLSPKYEIIQYYGRDDIGKYRFRLQKDLDGDPDNLDFILTRKKKLARGVFEEFEVFSNVKEFGLRMNDFTSSISKLRFIIEHEGLKFEIDKFTSISMVIMEVELPHIDHPFTFPKEIEEWNIVKEITGDKAMSNSKLSIPII